MKKCLVITTFYLITGCVDYEVNKHPEAEYLAFKSALIEKKEASNSQESVPEDPLARAQGHYDSYCKICHAEGGKGDSAVALAMQPQPRNLSDPEWQKSRSDEHIYKVIEQGGQSVGLSATMPGWASLLGPEELEEMVRLVRSYSL